MFSKSADFYDAIYSFKDYAGETAQVAGLIRSIQPAARTILDVACGTGKHARLLATDYGFEVDGLDLDPGLLRVAREKHPSGRFFEADMGDFTLGRRYHVVLCLFSSIGYLVTLERAAAALACFRRHLEPGGTMFVEPWFAPGALSDGKVFRHVGMHKGMRVERVSRNEVDGRVSRLHFEYRIEGPAGERVATEVHELGLFTDEEMRQAFSQAGLDATLDPVGLTGRGMWTATQQGKR